MPKKYMLTLDQMLALSRKVEDKSWEVNHNFDLSIVELEQLGISADEALELDIKEYIGEVGTQDINPSYVYEVSIYCINTRDSTIGRIEVIGWDEDNINSDETPDFEQSIFATNKRNSKKLADRYKEISKYQTLDEDEKDRKPFYDDILKIIDE
jgi:hypothetical protein